MAKRRRDYRAEYQARLERGARAGLRSRAAAAGHALNGEETAAEVRERAKQSKGYQAYQGTLKAANTARRRARAANRRGDLTAEQAAQVYQDAQAAVAWGRERAFSYKRPSGHYDPGTGAWVRNTKKNPDKRTQRALASLSRTKARSKSLSDLRTQYAEAFGEDPDDSMTVFDLAEELFDEDEYPE